MMKQIFDVYIHFIDEYAKGLTKLGKQVEVA